MRRDNAKAANAILFNLSNVVIHNIINKEKVKTIYRKENRKQCQLPPLTKICHPATTSADFLRPPLPAAFCRRSLVSSLPPKLTIIFSLWCTWILSILAHIIFSTSATQDLISFIQWLQWSCKLTLSFCYLPHQIPFFILGIYSILL